MSKQRVVEWLGKAWKDNRSLLFFLALMLVFRSAIADWNEVPTGSMKPTIIEGDRLLVNKMAYDLRIPFTHVSLMRMADPERGDIVIFDSEASDRRLVKRVVGLPGDRIEMKNNVLKINGKRITYRNVTPPNPTTDKIEDLLGVEHLVRIQESVGGSLDFHSVEVPPDHYLVLGDNRNNSADSRSIGFVPRKEIVGRSRSLVLSLNYENFYIPRADRFLQTL